VSCPVLCCPSSKKIFPRDLRLVYFHWQSSINRNYLIAQSCQLYQEKYYFGLWTKPTDRYFICNNQQSFEY
jgi:hypothetical protein